MGKASRSKKELKRRGLADTVTSGRIGSPEWLRALEDASKRQVEMSNPLSHDGAGVGDTVVQVFDAADQVIRIVQGQADRMVAQGRAEFRTACVTGCDHCCFAEVTVGAPEVVAIAEHLQTQWKPQQRQDLLDRVKARNLSRAELTDEEKAKTPAPCPFLVESRCTVYDVRPFACRVHHSTDVGACRRAREGEPAEIPVITQFGVFTSPLIVGHLHGFRKLGLKTEPLWFTEAMEIVLDDPGAIESWASGEDPFEKASKAEFEARSR